MGYAVDPELQPWISMMPDLDVRDLPAARALIASAMPPFDLPDGVTMEERSIPGPVGAPDVRVLVFAPVAGTIRPAMVYMHGGGFVLGNVDGDKELPSLLSAGTGAVVVSVDYRLAPENPFPAPLEDCYAALEWVASNTDELGVDPARIGIGGVSAGAGLAAGVALLARDRGGPALCFQMLDIPEIDNEVETVSMQNFTDTPMWNRGNALASWGYYLGPDHSGEVSPYAAPSRAEDLSNLPPAYITSCEFDPLRDEGLAYGQRLVQAGVPTELHLYPGTFHGSGGLVPTVDVSRRMRAELIAATRRGLSAGTRVATAEAVHNVAAG